MKRTTIRPYLVLALGLGILGAAPTQAQDIVTCESLAEQFLHCPAITHGGVNLARPLSRNPCILGSSWGFDDSGIWVDKGCRASFRLGSPWAPSTPDQSLGYLRCQSFKNQREYCVAPTQAGVTLLRQLSSNPCVQGSNWGYDGGGIWVDRGCRAEFRLGGGTAARPPASSGPAWVPPPASQVHAWPPPSYGPTWPPPPAAVAPPPRETHWVDQIQWKQPEPMTESDETVLRCESREDRRQYCPADVRHGVTLLRQLSRSACVENTSWGVDKGGIWVDKGCRAEFRLEE